MSLVIISDRMVPKRDALYFDCINCKGGEIYMQSQWPWICSRESQVGPSRTAAWTRAQLDSCGASMQKHPVPHIQKVAFQMTTGRAQGVDLRSRWHLSARRLCAIRCDDKTEVQSKLVLLTLGDRTREFSVVAGPLPIRNQTSGGCRIIDTWNKGFSSDPRVRSCEKSPHNRMWERDDTRGQPREK